MTRLLLAACALAVIATGCDTYSYPTPPLEKEQMKKNEWVYGDPDKGAHQHENSYPADPDQAAKADAIKKQLFMEDQPGVTKVRVIKQMTFQADAYNSGRGMETSHGIKSR